MATERVHQIQYVSSLLAELRRMKLLGEGRVRRTEFDALSNVVTYLLAADRDRLRAEHMTDHAQDGRQCCDH